MGVGVDGTERSEKTKKTKKLKKKRLLVPMQKACVVDVFTAALASLRARAEDESL